MTVSKVESTFMFVIKDFLYKHHIKSTFSNIFSISKNIKKVIKS